MGSESDLNVMLEAAEILKLFDVKYEIRIVSAHRTVDKMIDYARTCRSRGIRVIIAGAGGAAHLPGMLASLTTLPVIGVPIRISFDGVDSLLSIVQMPFGVPVATVAVNGSKNAGLLACQILALEDEELSNKLNKYRKEMEQRVLQSSEDVERKLN
ncbi:MAG: 5-(carboxyamino)imidazole ribonucleotide mutase [Nitrososphaeraceae archaeon]|jgi:5-(carboxyamino)imidazole ribonucleotide mutase